MMLLTKANRKALPKLGATDKSKKIAMAIVKFFDPTSQWTWYAIEFDGTDRFFGLVHGHETEFGYFSLKKLQSVRGRFGLGIERDLWFKPTPITEIHKKYMLAS